MSEITEAEAIKDNLKLSRRILGLPQETTFEYLQRIVQKSLQNGVNIFKRIFQGQQKHQDTASQAEVQNKQNQIKATKRYDFKLFQGSPQQSTHEDNYKMQQSLKVTEKLPSLNNISGQIQFQKSSSAQKSVQSFYKSGRKRLKRDPSDSSIYKSSKKPYSQKSKQEKEFEQKISFEYFCDYRESLIEARKRQKQAPVQQQKSLKKRYEQYAQKVATLNGPIDNNNPSQFYERSPRILEIRRQRQQRKNLRKKVQFEQEEHHQLYNIDKVNEVLDQQVQRRRYQRKLQQEKKIRILQERRKFEESERIRIFQQQQRKEAAIQQENRRRQQLQLARKAQQQRQIIEKQKRQKQERQKLNIDEQRQRQQALRKQSSRNQLPPFDQQPNQASNYEDSSNIASRPAELNSQQSSQVVQQQIVSKSSEQNQNAVPSLSISPSKANKVEQKETPPKQPQKNNPFKNTPQTKNLTLHDLIGTNNNNGDGVRSLPKQQNASPQKSNIFKSPSGVISNLFINGQQQNSQQFPIAQPSPSIMQNQQSNLYSNNQNIGNPLFGNSFGNNQPTSMNPLISANNFNNQNQNNSMIAHNPMNFMSSRGMNNNSMSLGTPTGSNQMGLGYGSMVQNNSHPQFSVANPSPQLNQMFPPNQMGLNTPGSSGSSANSYISPQNPANPPRNFFMQTNPQNEPSLFSTTNPNQNKQSSVSKKKGTVRIS